MYNPFKPLEHITTEVFTTLPAKFRKKNRSAWSDPNRQNAEVECFLEGPAFDREGNLWVCDIPFGRIFRITPKGDWDLVLQYDGWPNGIAIHKDGSIFIADYRRGILRCDPKTGRVEDFLTHNQSEGFKGVNDLTFARNGDLYFTDQGQTGIHDPTGRVYRYGADGRLDGLIGNGPSPNGIVLDPQDKVMYVAMTRANCMWHCPLKGGGISKAGVFAVLPGIHGPDGLAMDEAGNLSAAHARPGIVWLFSPLGEPLARVQSRKSGNRMTNMAYGGADRKTLYVVDSYRGEVLTAPMPVAGKVLYSHL